MKMVDQASADIHPKKYGRGSATLLVWEDSVRTTLLCNTAFIGVIVLKWHYAACLICSWFGWFMIGISVLDGEYSSLFSAWTYLVMLGAPIGETVQFEREAVLCCAVVLLVCLPLFVGTSVIDSTEESLYVVTDILQVFRIGGALYTDWYMALLGLMLGTSRFAYFKGIPWGASNPGVSYFVGLAWMFYSVLPLTFQAGNLSLWRSQAPLSRKTTLFSIALASFGTIFSLGIRWTSMKGPLSHLVDLESPVYQATTVLLTLCIELVCIVGFSQVRRRAYPEQYIYSFHWGAREVIARISQWQCFSWHLIQREASGSDQFSVDVKHSLICPERGWSMHCHPCYGSTLAAGNTFENSVAEQNVTTSRAGKAILSLLSSIVASLIPPLLAIMAIAGISLVDDPCEARWQLIGSIGWFGLLYSIMSLQLSSSIVAWTSLIAFGSNCGNENSPQRMMAILIGTPCFLFIVRHFNTKVRHISSKAPLELSDVEMVYDSTGTLGVACLVAIQWFLAVVYTIPSLSTIILWGPKFEHAVIQSIKPWQLDIYIFVGAIEIGSIIALVCVALGKSEEVAHLICSLVCAPMVQVITRLILAVFSFNFVEPGIEAFYSQVYSAVWTLLVVLMFICICGISNGHPVPDIVWLVFIKGSGAVPLYSIRATFGLSRRLKLVRDHLGTWIELDDIDQ